MLFHTIHFSSVEYMGSQVGVSECMACSTYCAKWVVLRDTDKPNQAFNRKHILDVCYTVTEYHRVLLSNKVLFNYNNRRQGKLQCVQAVLPQRPPYL